MPPKGNQRFQSPLTAQRKATQQETLAMNLTVLQRIDRSIVEVMDMAGHVVVYNFNPATQAWQKRDIEGSLFVVRTAFHPMFKCMLLNRSGKENFEVPITGDTLVQLDSPYLICRSGLSQEVIGLWFYKEDEYNSLSSLVQSLIQSTKDGVLGGPPPGQPMPPMPPMGQPMPPHGQMPPMQQPGPPMQPAMPPGHGPPPQSVPAQPPMPGGDEASNNLRGILGIAPGGGGDAAPAKNAGAEIMSMLNVGAALPTDAAPMAPAPAAPLPQPYGEPPSPGSAIMAMLGQAPSQNSVAQPPAPQLQPAPTKAPNNVSAQAPAAPLTPSDLLRDSVSKSAAKAGVTMTKDQFREAMQRAVNDEAFISDLYAQYMKSAGGK